MSEQMTTVDNSDLVRRQAELVASLVAGAATPAGFDERTVEAARAALLRKRAGDVASHWPRLAAAHGADWAGDFIAWARTRPTSGSLRDGWDFARICLKQPVAGSTTPAWRLAAIELATREARWRYDGARPPRRRRLPALRRATGSTVLQFAGRIRVLG